MANREKLKFGDKEFTLEVSFKMSGLSGVLDDENGAALVFQSKDGSRLELFFRDGKLHRVDGPAIDAKGKFSRMPMYFREGISQPPPTAPSRSIPKSIPPRP